jgi:SAM-dependent methyltransferase
MSVESNLDYVSGLLKHYQSAQIDLTISPTETMNDEWYFPVGKYAVETIATACVSAKIRDVRTVLDVPCGHGRVLRHLVHLFPGATFHACDLDRAGVEFCARTFGAAPVHSIEDLTKVDFGTLFDVIWVGSLFTHTSQKITRAWLAHLARFLTPQGIVVATFHGRWSQFVHEILPFTDDLAWGRIVADYERSGYGYRDYPVGIGHSYVNGSYGVSLAKPNAILRDIEQIPGVRIHLYRERGWGDNHDVVAFGRPSYDELWAVMPTDCQRRAAGRTRMLAFRSFNRFVRSGLRQTRTWWRAARSA